MQQRMDMSEVSPEGYSAVLGLEKYVRANVDHTLLELVKLRASVLNGCAFCVDMHSQDALKAGEDARRLFAVGAWREAPFFTEVERAALALTDEVTRLGEHGVTDEVWAAAQDAFSDRELSDLILAIATINVWNRIGVSTHLQPPAL
ncbi:carboxymuconolactone decarboxylase family protein [Yinghuangia seranimata]|uniref:carboxymuconolactone decarboxylase family protein n=1 Tax=Yinghuangia seranimata TaxID=408067 RepID=UPI00248C125A|nr:carboxymuconolactone decarboxylase family protein [Yinghuangia seranimata]MDI2132370.1 carboxymuconolactone decarboxylase family protein [Yinghuangia seranimata]